MTSDTTETVSLDILIARPPEDVWAALTQPDLLARWWATSDISPDVGHRFTIDMGKWGQQPCEVLESDFPHRFVYSFADWRLVWTLTPEGQGTRLRVDHEGFDLANPQHKFAFETMGPGWRSAVLPRLATLLETA